MKKPLYRRERRERREKQIQIRRPQRRRSLRWLFTQGFFSSLLAIIGKS